MKFRSRQHAMGQRQPVWICLACRREYTRDTIACDDCHRPPQYFASTQEYRRYAELALEQRAGLITGLQLQPVFPVVLNGKRVFKYIADFKYTRGDQEVVEDVKGSKNPAHHDPVFRLKKKVVEAVYGIEITVTT